MAKTWERVFDERFILPGGAHHWLLATKINELKQFIVEQLDLKDDTAEKAQRTLHRWQQYASYCRCCAQSGENDPHDFEQFSRYMEAIEAGPPKSA